MNRTLQSRLLHGSLCPRLLHGEMAERFNAAVLKTAVGQPTVGSNPTLSASFLIKASCHAMPVFAEHTKEGKSDLSAVPIPDNAIHRRMTKLTGEFIPGAV